MTAREINELRKSGELEEALKNAEELFGVDKSVYAVGALFWCLNDLCKQQQRDEATATFERMKQLCEEFCPEDEYMLKAIASTETRLTPHRDEVKQAVERAKGGDIRAFAEIDVLYKSGDLKATLYNDFGWLIYYTLKHTPTSDAAARKRLLARYFNLDLERPSILHSLILSEGVRLEQNTPLQFRIRDFVRMWGLENLRDEDWEQFKTTEGNILPSLVEKLIGVYAKELKTDRVAPADDFVELLDKALPKFTNNQNMPYFKATTLIAQGRADEAIRYYKQLILRFPAKAYLWNQLSAIVDDSEIQIGLLCRAVNTGEDEGFIGNARLRLASALVAKGLLSNARAEIEKYRATYIARGWHLKPEFIDIANRIPVTTPIADNSELYARYHTVAEQFIYSEIPSEYAVKISDSRVDDRNHPGRKYTQWRLKSTGKFFYLKKPNKYKLDNRAPNGAIFEIKVQNEKIVWIRPAAEIPALDWLKTVTGVITPRTDRKGNPYAIVSGVYVSSDLLEVIKRRGLSEVKLLAERRDGDRWSAIAVM